MRDRRQGRAAVQVERRQGERRPDLQLRQLVRDLAQQPGNDAAFVDHHNAVGVVPQRPRRASRVVVERDYFSAQGGRGHALSYLTFFA